MRPPISAPLLVHQEAGAPVRVVELDARDPLLDTPRTITVFRDEHDNRGSERTTSWRTWIADLLARNIERGVTAFAPATFERCPADKLNREGRPCEVCHGEEPADRHRLKDNARNVVALVLDYDGGEGGQRPTTIDEAAALWSFAGVLYTTRSHLRSKHGAPAVPRFRVVLPLPRAVSPAEHAAVMRWAFARALAAGHELDFGCKDASRLWFTPQRSDAVVRDLRGLAFPLDLALAEAPPEPFASAVETDQEAEAARRAALAEYTGPRNRPDAFNRFRAYLDKHPGAQSANKGGRETFRVAAYGVKGLLLSTHEVFSLMAGDWNKRCDPPWTARDLAHKVNEAHRYRGIGWGEKLTENRSDFEARAPEPRPSAERSRAPGPVARDAADDDAAERAAIEGEPAERRAAIEGEGGEAPAPEAPAERAAFEWIGISSIMAPLPPTPWIVRGLQFCPGRPAMIAAYGSSGKTLALQSLALACAAGRRVWGEFSPRGPMKVRHLDHEQGRNATLRRYQRLALGYSIDAGELAEVQAHDRLAVSILPAVYLTDANAEDVYARAFEGVDLVALDALRGATPGVDENDSRIRECLDRLTRVSERIGTAFLFVHHSGKPKEGHADARTVPRGSSAIFDACGSVFVMAGEKGEPKLMRHEKSAAEAEGGNVEDFYLKIEDVPADGNPTAGVRIRYQTKEQVHPPTSPETRIAAMEKAVLAAVEKNPRCSRSLLRGILSGKNEVKDAAIERLCDRGLLRNQGTETKGAFVLATPAERDADA